MVLAKIGHMMPWMGDPYLIPLAHLPARYEEAERLRVWLLGKEDAGDGADEILAEDVRELKAKARKQKRVKAKMRIAR